MPPVEPMAGGDAWDTTSDIGVSLLIDEQKFARIILISIRIGYLENNYVRYLEIKFQISRRNREIADCNRSNGKSTCLQ